MIRVLLFGIIVVAVLCISFVCGNAIINSINSSGRERKRALEDERAAHAVTESRLDIAERGLRKIANNVAGNPALEAQIILDDIDNYKAIE